MIEGVICHYVNKGCKVGAITGVESKNYSPRK
jgi:hypothetical protein